MKNALTDTSAPNGVLAGLHVIELSRMLSGPLAGASTAAQRLAL